MTFSLHRTPRHMSCIEFVELLNDYLDGVLPARERRAFEHHLALCDGCVSYLAQMRETTRLTGALGVDDVPDKGVERVMDAFRAYQTERADNV